MATVQDLMSVPDSLVEKTIGSTSGEIVLALYEFGVRKKLVDSRTGQEYTPGWYEDRQRPHRRSDSTAPNRDERVKLDLAVRRRIVQLAEEAL